MKAYPKYIDSGVEWIGNIPIHWSNTRIRSVVESVVNGVWGDEPQEDENDIVCVRVADFDMQKLGVGKEKLTIRNIPESQQNGRLLYKDDLLVEKSGGGDIQPVGRVVRFDLDEKAVNSNFIGKISVNKSKVLPVFLLYYLSNLYNKAINTRSIKQLEYKISILIHISVNEFLFLRSLNSKSSRTSLNVRRRRLMRLSKRNSDRLICSRNSAQRSSIMLLRKD